MKTKLIHIIGGVLLGVVLIAAPHTASAQASPGGTEKLVETVKRGASFVAGIEARLNSNRDDLKLLKKNVRNLEIKIEESDVRIGRLESQINNFDRLIAWNQAKAHAVRQQVALHENSIAALQDEKEAYEKILRKNIASLEQALSVYYLHANTFFESESGAPLLLAFLASDESTGDILSENEYLLLLHGAGRELSQRIQRTTEQIQKTEKELEKKSETLDELRELLASEELTLKEAHLGKQRLLAETKGKQEIYQSLLELAKREEEQVAVQIVRLKENYAFFQVKLDELKNDIPDSEKFFNDEITSGVLPSLASGETPLSWPVSPSLGLSAHYQDEAYKKALGVPHNAIDIRIPQGSKIRAAADGVVTKAADNGLAYSYTIIGHPNNLLTLYGHMSEIFVKEGDIVRTGDVIGLSGGIPGTKGAGWLTTGAHLHFEVFKNFKHDDPLEYLPLEYVPVATLPGKFLNRVLGTEREKVKRPTLDLAP